MVTRPRVAFTGKRFPKYGDAIARAGGEATEYASEGDPAALLDAVDALLLGGGADIDPARYGETAVAETYGVDDTADAFDIALLHGALERSMRVLAICRGFQVVNVAFGGSLFQHIVREPGVEPHGRPGVPNGELEHKVTLETGSQLAAVMGATTVTASCHHHQAVARLGDGLRITARAHDGIVEGIELGGVWVLAVQWHPEDLAPTDPANQALFDALINGR
jgi:putative glutamine amidotransferase